jgi:hypothetical protein
VALIVRHSFEEITKGKGRKKLTFARSMVAKFIVYALPELLLAVVKNMAKVSKVRYFACLKANLLQETSNVLKTLYNYFVPTYLFSSPLRYSLSWFVLAFKVVVHNPAANI